MKIGIVPRDFPKRTITASDFARIRKSLLLSISAQGSSPFKPRFSQGMTSRAGWLVLHCSNLETANWVKSLDIWIAYDCNVVFETEFPRGYKAVAFFPRSSDLETELILGVIQGENEGISTADWKVLHRSDSEGNVTLVFHIDAASAERLKVLKYFIDFGIGQRVRFRIKEQGPSSSEGLPPEPMDTVPPVNHPPSMVLTTPIAPQQPFAPGSEQVNPPTSDLAAHGPRGSQTTAQSAPPVRRTPRVPVVTMVSSATVSQAVVQTVAQSSAAIADQTATTVADRPPKVSATVSKSFAEVVADLPTAELSVPSRFTQRDGKTKRTASLLTEPNRPAVPSRPSSKRSAGRQDSALANRKSTGKQAGSKTSK